MTDKPDALFIAAASYSSVDEAVADYQAVKMLYHEIKASHDFDAAVIKHFATISRPERMDVLRPIIHQISDELIVMGLFYDTTVTLVSNRVKGVTAGSQGWNVQDWDV